MAAKEEQKTREIHINDGLSTALVDNVHIGSRSDELVFLRFLTQLPEGVREEARLMIPKSAFVRMLDVMCSHMDHYPKKPVRKKAVKKVTRKKALKRA